MTVPRRAAIPLMQPVKEKLERMEKLGVISQVSKPTESALRLELLDQIHILVIRGSVSVVSEQSNLSGGQVSPNNL